MGMDERSSRREEVYQTDVKIIVDCAGGWRERNVGSCLSLPPAQHPSSAIDRRVKSGDGVSSPMAIPKSRFRIILE